MNRLTFDGNFCDISQCRELPCPYNNACTQRQVWERLKQYEDSGLSPIACKEARKIEDRLSEYDYSIARMVELMQADKDGRVVVHGRFVHDGQLYVGGLDWFHCSSCGRLVAGAEARFDYCPWCGARMGGGIDNETD